MKAKKKELQTVAIGDFLKVNAKQETQEMYFPEKIGDGLVLEGDTDLLADDLIEILKERTSVFA
jgi:electron transfer flavoprotein beta subunit